MGEDLKIKASPFLILTRILVVSLLILSFVLGYLATVDMSGNDEKESKRVEESFSELSLKDKTVFLNSDIHRLGV